jgi:tRNA dimethylallyltransferase
MRSTGKPVVVILGPTAVGKTGLAIEIAQALDGEIVGADSRQIYREMDIGTAKPTAEERMAAIHHLIDIVTPDEDYPLAHYQRDAFAAIDTIQQRGRLPLLVGGTGQYITAVLEGWSIPEVRPNETLRAKLEAFAATDGVEALYTRLLKLDPAAESFVEPRNLRRIVRALEVIDATGQPFSAMRGKNPPPYDVRTYGLTMERDALYQRADQRIDMMMEHGFLDEVRGLLDKGYARKLPSMSGLGYAQLADHMLEGKPLAQAVTETKFATHQFIRRQYTWFRGHDHQILWHNVGELAPETLIEATARWLAEEAEQQT